MFIESICNDNEVLQANYRCGPGRGGAGAFDGG
jgi:hypothetical protein